jgi:hypothetical protein
VYIPMFVPSDVRGSLKLAEGRNGGATGLQILGPASLGFRQRCSLKLAGGERRGETERFLLSHDAVLFWQVRDLPGTAVKGQRSPGRGCSVCSSAARSFVRVRVS